MTDTRKATFGAGCFWGVEVAFRQVPGVLDAVAGYEGGTLANPSYRDVCTGRTRHAEWLRSPTNRGRTDLPSSSPGMIRRRSTGRGRTTARSTARRSSTTTTSSAGPPRRPGSDGI
jgi:hypothetical protein